MQTLTAGHQILCFQTEHERVDRSVFEPRMKRIVQKVKQHDKDYKWKGILKKKSS